MKNILLAFCIAFLSLNLFSNENYIDQNNGFFYCIYSPTVTSYKTVAKGLGDCELTIDDTGVVDKSGC